MSTGQGDDYTTGCLLDYEYFKDNYGLIAADLSKQKALDTDTIENQQIVFTAIVKMAAIIYYFFEQSKETALEIYKETNFFCVHINGWIQESKS